MDQDAKWYGGKPQRWPHCVRWGPSPQFSAHVCCGQTAGWIKIQLDWNVDLGQGNIVFDGTPKGAQPPCHFLAHVCCAQMAG